jgi:hypothetical protein
LDSLGYPTGSFFHQGSHWHPSIKSLLFDRPYLFGCGYQLL